MLGFCGSSVCKMRWCGLALAAVLACFVITVSSKFVFVDKTRYEGSECTTYDGRPGVCSFHCDAITDDQFKNVEDMCGFDQKQVTVCCPTNGTTKTSDLPTEVVASTLVPKPTVGVVSQSPSTTSLSISTEGEVATSSKVPYPILKEACAYRTAKQMLRNDYIDKIRKAIEDETQWRLDYSEQNRQQFLKDEDDLIESCRAEGSAIGGDKGMQYTQWCETLRSQIIYTVPKPELVVETYKYSHMAVLGWTQTNNTVSWNCGATLIHKNFLLTAAHCIFNLGTPPDLVRIADSNLLRSKGDKFAIDFDIEKIVTHELYDSVTYYNDIALIRVKMQPRFKEKQPPLPACVWTEKDYPTETFTTLGYGAPAFGQEFVLVLKVNNLTLVNNTECSGFYEMSNELPEGIKDHQICAADPEELTDTCEGDSGGPLQFSMVDKIDTPYLIGITSFGLQCLGGNPGVYTKVYDFVEWIERNLREMME